METRKITLKSNATAGRINVMFFDGENIVCLLGFIKCKRHAKTPANVDCNYKDFLTTTGVLMSSGELRRQGDHGEAGRV